MATTGFVSGNDFRIYVNGNAIAQATSCDVNASSSPRDVTTKDSGGWKKVLYGLKEWSISGDGLVALDDSFGHLDLGGFLIAGTAVTVRYTTDTTGDEYYTGAAIVDSVSISSPANETPTYTFNLTGNGPLTKPTFT